MADDTVYEIGIDIIPVRVRPCQPYQERISDYGSDGRPHFEWEEMRHKKILFGDESLDAVCAECTLNIFQTAEGCKSHLYGLDIFLRAVARLAPDSLWAGITLETKNYFDAQRTIELAEDLSHLDQIFTNSTWKVAQLWAYDEPVMEYFEDGSSRPRFYPWNGEAPPSLINANEGYQIYLCAHGILVKSNYEDVGAYTYTKLLRDESGVSGLTKDGETINFRSLMARRPEWDKDEPNAYGELRFVEMSAAEVFRDTLDMLMVFSDVARQSKTGFYLNIL